MEIRDIFTPDIRKIAKEYYSRKDIQQLLISEAKNREIAFRYVETFGKRPDILQYENDIYSLAEKGVTSFHMSEEIWSEPLELKTEMSKEELDKLRIGWDLIIDIDSKYLEYNKIAAELLVEALKFHNIKNMGVKFSGGTGFHVGLSFKAFPKKIQSLNIKDFFPEGPRLIASYLKEMIKKPLSERILSLNSLSEIATSLKKPEEEFIVDGQFDPFTIVSIDTILISSRHLFRMPYSLHEKTKLASVVIKPEQIKEFHIGWAKPSRVFPRVFLPEPEKDEARELLTQALDWKARRKSEEKEKEKIESKFEQIKIENITDDLFPKCIRNILEGIKKDGRKRALFVLITFFRSLHMDENIIEKRIFEWNLKNYRPLKEGYIKAQLDWFKKQKRILPPNCDNDSYYKDLGVCENDSCRNIKNPVNYVLRQIRINEAREYNSKRGRKRKNI
ncbi:hypothetical protein AUJ10_00385 [Candidatus Pacearchaeota archaeon CG1_02_31_27]|nr:MAG: hypothetical protein AUJ10_00385 [Candidatus Pacearchaeota archaeon CG1_02_31_27]